MLVAQALVQPDLTSGTVACLLLVWQLSPAD